MKRLLPAMLFLACSLFVDQGVGVAADIRIGTWKTAQTIQPFFYEKFLPPGQNAAIFSFTNPADQKVALLAGSLDMCGTTLAHAIHSASRGEPVVLVAALCNKSSALVVRENGPIKAITDLKGKKIGYVPGTMHEILLRETLTRNGLSPATDVHLTRVDFFDMGMALARGSIDAFLSGEPFPSLALHKWLRENPVLSVLWGIHRDHQCRDDRKAKNHRRESGPCLPVGIGSRPCNPVS